MLRCTKDPDARMDFGVDWRAWLVDDEIEESIWDVTPAGLTIDVVDNDATSATIWVRGGVLGKTYEAVNRIRTLAGRRDDRTILIKIAEK